MATGPYYHYYCKCCEIWWYGHCNLNGFCDDCAELTADEQAAVVPYTAADYGASYGWEAQMSGRYMDSHGFD